MESIAAPAPEQEHAAPEPVLPTHIDKEDLFRWRLFDTEARHSEAVVGSLKLQSANLQLQFASAQQQLVTVSRTATASIPIRRQARRRARSPASSTPPPTPRRSLRCPPAWPTAVRGTPCSCLPGPMRAGFAPPGEGGSAASPRRCGPGSGRRRGQPRCSRPDRWTWRFLPSVPVDPAAQRVHGIGLDELAGAGWMHAHLIDEFEHYKKEHAASYEQAVTRHARILAELVVLPVFCAVMRAASAQG